MSADIHHESQATSAPNLKPASTIQAEGLVAAPRKLWLTRMLKPQKRKPGLTDASAWPRCKTNRRLSQGENQKAAAQACNGAQQQRGRSEDD